MQRSPWLRRQTGVVTRRGIVIVALAIAIFALAAAALMRPSEVSAPGQGRASAPPATDLGLVVAEMDEGTWWRIGWRPLDAVDEPPDFERLTVGRMSGEIVGHVQLGANQFAGIGVGGPFVTGPKRGLILYSRRTGDSAELHLLDTSSGDDRVLVSTGAVLHHADLAPTSGFAFFVTGSRSPGIWRVALDGTRGPELLVDLPELARDLEPVLATAPVDGLPTQVTVRVDAEVANLAVLICSPACVLRVIDLVTGAEIAVEGLDAAFRQITDFVDGVVVVGSSGYDAESGNPAPVPDDARAHADTETGWELPPGWRIEQRPLDPRPPVVGLTWYVAIGPSGEEIPIEAMGQGIGQG